MLSSLVVSGSATAGEAAGGRSVCPSSSAASEGRVCSVASLAGCLRGEFLLFLLAFFFAGFFARGRAGKADDKPRGLCWSPWFRDSHTVDVFG